MRFITPVILIAIAFAIFFVFATSLWQDIALLRTQASAYNEALNNSKALENERDKLTVKYNSISPENLEKLEKLLPENVDNIRLILEIGEIASPYGMVLKDVKYNTTEEVPPEAAGAIGAAQPPRVATRGDYGVWDLEFSTNGTYANFLNFVRALESNLRIVDISSIEFSSNVNVGANPALPEAYRYSFKIKTYWLKN